MTTDAEAFAVAQQHAGVTEQAGHLHPAVVAALTDAGLFRRWVAAEYGGAAASVTEGLRVIEAASRADGAAGWCVMIANTTALTSHRLTPEWADTIYADPRSCTGGFGMPAGTARLVDGGLEVVGHWSWGSGTGHCTWIGGGARVVDDAGERARTADGASTPFVFFDPADVELLDTWHVAGLEGTASTDYTVDRAFVPEGRWVQLVGADPLIESPLARFPFFGALAAGVAAVTVGLAERAIDEIVALGENRFSGSSRPHGERTPLQVDLALARINVDQARSHLHATADAAWALAERGADVPDRARVDLRLAAAGAARRCVEAVDLCYHAAGGVAVYRTSPLQRIFRDAHVAITHGMVSPRILEPLGRFLYGLPTDTTLL